MSHDAHEVFVTMRAVDLCLSDYDVIWMKWLSNNGGPGRAEASKSIEFLTL